MNVPFCNNSSSFTSQKRTLNILTNDFVFVKSSHMCTKIITFVPQDWNLLEKYPLKHLSQANFAKINVKKYPRNSAWKSYKLSLTLNAPIATKVVCFLGLVKCLRNLYGKQCGPRSDCSYSSLFWVHAVFFYTSFVGYVRQLFAADNFSRRHFQIHFSWRFKG